VDELKASGKPFEISKQEVWDAWLKVKGNKGAPGVDGQSIEAFGKDLGNNLYKVWNRMSSGTYFPAPVRAVEIPKPHGGGTRVLGVPCVADRIAQTVAAARLEKAVEPVFHPDSYGYRPRRGAPDAGKACVSNPQQPKTGCSDQPQLTKEQCDHGFKNFRTSRSITQLYSQQRSRHAATASSAPRPGRYP